MALVNNKVDWARVLVVDDSKMIRRILTGYLTDYGIRDKHEVDNGRSALQVLKSRPFDIVISDWNMPSMSGIELLKAVRHEPELAEMPFILITSEGEKERVVEGVQHGVTDFLVKPFNYTNFAQKLDKAVKILLSQ